MEDCKPGLRRERDNNFIVTEAITLAGLGWAGLGLGWGDEMVTGSNQLGTMSRKGVSLQLHKHALCQHLHLQPPAQPPAPATYSRWSGPGLWSLVRPRVLQVAGDL